MAIQVKDTSIPDIKLIVSQRITDERGFFVETHKENEYQEFGIPRFVQDNMSESKKGVIRGLHWQENPYGQGKLVSCIAGRILDVAVDIRIGSTTFGKHIEIELSDTEPTALWIPEGFAHGFQALEENTRVSYKVTNYWKQNSEKSISPLDPEINIKWPIANPIISKKDASSPKLDAINFNL
jgi:dTDP-4-dehydrorhamnose 3,5-epimerase